MRFAYADPPYLGQAKKHYAADERCAEVNHEMLIAHLNEFDGWALSLSAPSLRAILPMCPEDARVCAWVKPFASFKANVTRAYAWEPVIVWGGRAPSRDQPTVRDWVSASITLQRGLAGAKPRDFCRWLFEFMGVQKHDEFHDLFPGSGAVMAALNEYLGRHEAQPAFRFAALSDGSPLPDRLPITEEAVIGLERAYRWADELRRDDAQAGVTRMGGDAEGGSGERSELARDGEADAPSPSRSHNETSNDR